MKSFSKILTGQHPVLKKKKKKISWSKHISMFKLRCYINLFLPITIPRPAVNISHNSEQKV